MIKILNFFKRLTEYKPDPVKHCKVYRAVGCAHVDGMLCDMQTCNIKAVVIISPNKIEDEINK